MAGRVESKNGYARIPGHNIQSNATAELEDESNPAHWLKKLDDLDKMEDGPRKEKLVTCLFSRMHRKLNPQELHKNESYAVVLGKAAMFDGMKSLESGRLQFESAISACQTEIIYIMYAQFELNHGNRRLALSVLQEARDIFENSLRLNVAIAKLCDGHTDISFADVNSCFRSDIVKPKVPQKLSDDSGFDTMPRNVNLSSCPTKTYHDTPEECNLTHPTHVKALPSANNSLLNFSAECPLPVTPQFRPKKFKSPVTPDLTLPVTPQFCPKNFKSPVTPDLSQHSKEYKTFKLAETKDMPKHASPVLKSVENKRNVKPDTVASSVNKIFKPSSVTKKLSSGPQRVLRVNKIDSDDDSPQYIRTQSKRTDDVEPLPMPQGLKHDAGTSESVHDVKPSAFSKPQKSEQDTQQTGQRKADIARAVDGNSSSILHRNTPSISASTHSAFKPTAKYVKAPILLTDKENQIPQVSSYKKSEICVLKMEKAAVSSTGLQPNRDEKISVTDKGNRVPQASFNNNSESQVHKMDKTPVSSGGFPQNRDENKFLFPAPISVTDKENRIPRASSNGNSEIHARKMETTPVFSNGFPQNNDGNRDTLSAKPQNQVSHASQLMRDKKAVVLNGVPYVVLNLLGKGGSSKVYKVYDPASSRIVAVKQVNLTEGDQQVLDGYKNEINFLKKLRGNRHIIELFDYELRERCLYLVMECGSSDLSAFLKSRRATGELLEAVDIKMLWKNMLRAVQAIHGHGIIHLDLKPANFMFVDFNLKLIDFGIANSIQADATSVIKDTQFGTLNYMAPETINDMSGGMQCGPGYQPKFKVGPKADVWSLGCILYYVLYGKTPFQHIHHQAIKVIAITSDNHKIDFPELETCDLVEIARVCLIRDPKKRPSVDMLLNHPILR